MPRAPDSVAREFLLLALRLDRLAPGLVESYFGPPELRALVDQELPVPAIHLGRAASGLQSGLASSIPEFDRRRWFAAQLVALEAQALKLAGDPLAYSDYVSCCFEFLPEHLPESVFDAAADELGRLLPAGPTGNSVTERLTAWEDRFIVPSDKLAGIVDWLLGVLRGRTDQFLGLPPDEQASVSLVTGNPWASRTTYLGHGRSRIDLNTELPFRAHRLISLVARESYPGHHTQRCWNERRLIEEQGRFEATISLINTPEALIRDGLAEVGAALLIPDPLMADLLVELYERANLPIAADKAESRDAADLEVRIGRATSSLKTVPANAALMLHSEGVPRNEVAAYLWRYLLTTPDRAHKQLEFIEHPLHRTSVMALAEGERLVRRWVEIGSTADHAARLGRLMREQMTPASLKADLASMGRGSGVW